MVDGQADVDVQLPQQHGGDGQRHIGLEGSGDVPVDLVGYLNMVTAERGDDLGVGVEVDDQRSRRSVCFRSGPAAGWGC